MIEPSKVVSVYSGRPGCMCGCRGRHTYAARFAEQAGRQRGYKVDEDEISDRSVRSIVSKLNKDARTKVEDGIAFLDTGTRYLAAYLEEAA